MNAARAFAAFWWDFMVGDDWQLTSGVVLALGSTVLLGHLGLPAWWLLPAALVSLLAGSLRRATRKQAVAEGAARRTTA